MKGVIFTEFLDLVESKYGMEMADRVLTKGCPGDAGFTSVGTYDYRILIDLVVELSKAIDQTPSQVVFDFGKNLFSRLLLIYPDATKGVTNTIDQIQRVQSVIHHEVTKLYTDVELPSFNFPPSPDGEFLIEYISARPFADFAEGLIAAAIEHFGDDLKIHRVDLDGPPGSHALFSLRPSTYES